VGWDREAKAYEYKESTISVRKGEMGVVKSGVRKKGDVHRGQQVIHRVIHRLCTKGVSNWAGRQEGISGVGWQSRTYHSIHHCLLGSVCCRE